MSQESKRGVVLVSLIIGFLVVIVGLLGHRIIEITRSAPSSRYDTSAPIRARAHVKAGVLVCGSLSSLKSMIFLGEGGIADGRMTPQIWNKLKLMYDCWNAPPNGYDVEIERLTPVAKVKPLNTPGVTYYVQSAAVVPLRNSKLRE